MYCAGMNKLPRPCYSPMLIIRVPPSLVPAGFLNYQDPASCNASNFYIYQRAWRK